MWRHTERHQLVGFSKMSNYHEGEKQVQSLAGARLNAERMSGSMRRSMPDAAQHFLDEQQFAAIPGGTRTVVSGLLP